MEWLEYPANTPPSRKDLFIRTEDNHYYVTKYVDDKFITYCTVTHFCVPDNVVVADVAAKEKTKKRGRPKKK